MERLHYLCCTVQDIHHAPSETLQYYYKPSKGNLETAQNL